MTAPRDATAFEVREALDGQGCPVCRLTLRAVDRFMAAIAYESVNDRPLRAELRATNGFCNPHAHRWLVVARSVLGTAVIYKDVLTSALRELVSQSRERGQWGGMLRGFFGQGEIRSSSSSSSSSGTGPACPACRAQRDAERRYLEALLESLGDAATAAAFATADPPCLRHTRAALALARGGPRAELVLERTRAAVGELLTVLDEVIRKEDYRYRHEERLPAERVAPAQAVAWAAGAAGLTGGDEPRPPE